MHEGKGYLYLRAVRWILVAPVAAAFVLLMWLAPHDCGHEKAPAK